MRAIELSKNESGNKMKEQQSEEEMIARAIRESEELQ